MKPLTNLIYKPAIFIDKKGKLMRMGQFVLLVETRLIASLCSAHPGQPVQCAVDFPLAGKTSL